MPIQSFEDAGKYFIKFFLLDATLNLNKWGVTEPSILANLDTFLGKPFVITPDFGHPTAASGDELLLVQDRYKVGTIIEVGLDRQAKKAFGIAEITDDSARELLRSGKVSFVSPSIVFNSFDRDERYDGSTIVNRFEGAHVAGVKDPAYGMLKAQIKGKCAGDKASCSQELAMVQASKKGKILSFETANKTMMLLASSCVEECIKNKADSGKEIDDQALAICYSECGESKGANIDQDSLDNITQVNMPGKPDKHCNKDKGLPCLDYESSSIKGENSQNKLMTTRNAELTEEEKKKLQEEQGEDMTTEEKKKKEEQARFRRQAEDMTDEEKKKKEDEMASLQSEVARLTKEAELAKKSPLVKQIVEAKTKMNLGNASEIDDFSKTIIELPEAVLSALSVDYELMASKSAQPKYAFETRYASVEQKKALDIDNFREMSQ